MQRLQICRAPQSESLPGRPSGCCSLSLHALSRNLPESPCARPSPRYMKYLYAYECEKKSLSSPAELQAAIDGNRREGRRPSYSSSLFSYSPTATGPPSLLSPPKIRFPIIGVAPGSGTSNPRVSPAAAVRKGRLCARGRGWLRYGRRNAIISVSCHFAPPD